MLESVDVGKRAIADYETTAGLEVVERLKELAKPLDVLDGGRGAHPFERAR